MMSNIQPPEPLSKDHVVNQFSSGDSSLDEWLSKRALKNEKNRASKTFVISLKGRVIGYYALSAGNVSHKEAYKKLARNMPDPIPAVTLGRLAIDKQYQSRGLGSSLLRDALPRVLNVANRDFAIKVVLVHAIDQKAIDFYRSKGFYPSPINQSTLMISVSEIEDSFS